MPETNSDSVKGIVESRLLEIYESLLDIRERVGKDTEAYKAATKSMGEISQAIDVKKLRQKEVRIDSNALKMGGGALNGKVILSDNEKVYELDIKDNEITDCKLTRGGFKQLEWLVTRLETSQGGIKPKKA